MLYSELCQVENRGIYTAIFDYLKDTDLKDLQNTYVKADQLDQRFEFENGQKEVLFKNLSSAVTVIMAKYFSKWENLYLNFVKNDDFVNGASSVTITNGTTNNNLNNKISAYDSSELVTDNGATQDTTLQNKEVVYNLTGKEFILNMYNNNNIYDIINTDVRHTLFKNVYILGEENNESNTN